MTDIDLSTDDRRKRRRRPEPTPAQRALGLLVRREHSSKELTRKLTARGVAEDAAATVVARMAAEGWQDDGRFAVSLARMRVNNGYGPIRIRAELGTHGLDAAVIAQAFAALAESDDDDWVDRARALASRRFGPDFSQDLARRRKAADFLLRRGFDGETIRNAMRSEPERG